MICISCNKEINAQWFHAIEANICPWCGKFIMEEHLKNLFSSLHETMSKLQQYPDQLNDWMLSNHQLIKTDSPNLYLHVPKELLRQSIDKDFQDRKKFTVKVATENGEEEVEAETLQSESKTSDFFKRAEVIKKSSDFKSTGEKTKHLKDIVNQIKKSGGTVNEFASGELANPEDVAEMSALLDPGTADFASQQNFQQEEDDDDKIPAIVLNNIANQKKSKGNGYVNPSDLEKLRQLEDRKRQTRENFENGTNRSAKGGGFSRV